MGRLVVAVPVVLSCVLISALVIVPAAESQPSPAPSATPVSADDSKASVVGELDFSPAVLNLDSAGKYVTMRLSLPEGYSVSSVYVPSLRFMGSVYAETCFSDHETGADKENSPHMMIKFLRSDVECVLSPGEAVSVFLTGMLIDGTPLYASGTLTVRS